MKTTTVHHCECDSEDCHLSVNLLPEVGFHLLAKKQIVIVDGCEHGPSENDELVEKREGYGVYIELEPFRWPQGTAVELKVYPPNHPQRKPTERYFAQSVRRDINDVREHRDFVNLWLLIDSLKNLSDPSVKSGFHTWLWAIEGVLGNDSCKEIGKRVCEEEKFTVEEGERLMEVYRQQEGEKYGLGKNASWDKIHRARDRAERH